jgi:hypothetical protein
MARDNDYILQPRAVFFPDILVFLTTPTSKINHPSTVSNCFQIRQA